jgi:NAD kinase
MVVCPESEMRDTLEAVRAWAAGNDVMLAGLADDPRLPADCDRRSPEELAAGCDAALAAGRRRHHARRLRLAAAHGTAVLGVNLGTLGYLAEIDAAHLPAALDALAGGHFTIERHAALMFTPEAGTGLPSGCAYNDIVLSRVPGRGQAALGVRIDEICWCATPATVSSSPPRWGRPPTASRPAARWSHRAPTA